MPCILSVQWAYIVYNTSGKPGNYTHEAITDGNQIESMTAPNPSSDSPDPLPADSQPDSATVKKGSGGFVGHVLALGSGNVIAQGLAVICAPIISRLFAPEAFGEAALITSIVMILGSVACLRYQFALMLPRDDKDAANLFGLGFVALISVTGLLALAVWLIGSTVLGWLKASSLEPYKWIIPASVFLLGFGELLRSWNSRHRHFKRLGATLATQGAVVPGLTIGAGAMGYQSGGNLIIVRFLGMMVLPLCLLYRLMRENSRFLWRHISLGRMKLLARRYIKFPMYDSWSALLAMTSRRFVPILLAAFWGLSTAGYFSRAQRLLLLPVTFFTAAIAQTLFQRLAAMKAAGEDLAKTVQEVTQRLICLAVLPSVVVAVIGPELFIVFCGARWAEAGVYAQILSPWIFVAIITSPLTPLINVLERIGVGLVFNIVLVVTRVSALLFTGWLIGDARGSLAMFSAVGCAGYLWMCNYLLSAVGVSRRRVVAIVIRHVGLALPTLGIAAAVKWWGNFASWQVVVIVAAASLSYWPLALWGDPVARRIFGRVVGKMVSLLKMPRQ